MNLIFKLEYHTRWGENLFLRTGSKACAMSYGDGGIWTLEIDSSELLDGKSAISYYYEVRTGEISTRHEWRLHTLAEASLCKCGDTATINDSWSDIPGWKGAGTAVPVFSLRSDDDLGTGEFLDLKKLVDWAAMTGQCLIQLLPVNDTTMVGNWTDSYPYNANSTVALHPNYINLQAVGITPDKGFKAIQKELNSLGWTDYENASQVKRRYLEAAFAQNWAKTCRTASYRKFFNDNKDWLVPYSVFCTLRDANGTPDFHLWGKYSTYDEAAVLAYFRKNSKKTCFHCYVQYHLDLQLRSVCDYARSKGVFLKGDLPIGISRTSVDAWQFPRLFNMDSQAGAPPDAFSADGQNWGFPTYNWDEMAKDGFAWWKRRLKKMNEYFNAFRIDHILGFFRIWEIPVPEKSGLMGHFSPALPYSHDELRSMGFADRMDCFLEDPKRPGMYHPRIDSRERLGWIHDEFFHRRHTELWKGEAIRRLSPLLGSTSMLTCGEDLGMIPPGVSEVMSFLNILSLEIQRMSKDSSKEFGDPATYPYQCVCSTSTHDMNPLRAWWEEDKEMTQRFYNRILRHEGSAPETCEPWICKEIVVQHLESPAMLAILPLQDWLSMDDGDLRFHGNPADERINIPANSRHYWKYRMHITLEQLLAADSFNTKLSTIVSNSGRSLR